MTGLYVSVPVACFRKGLAREYLETEPLPPPSTCYGFLLSLVGESDRRRHTGARVSAAIRGEPAVSTVLRTLWREKDKKLAPGAGSICGVYESRWRGQINERVFVGDPVHGVVAVALVVLAVGVEIDESGRHDEPRGVNGVATAERAGADRGDPPVDDPEVADGVDLGRGVHHPAAEDDAIVGARSLSGGAGGSDHEERGDERRV